jgi:tyrosyl-tRNA synthetase
MSPTRGVRWLLTKGYELVSQAVIDQVTHRGVREIISRPDFEEMMRSGRPLRLKMGFDPSRPDIHLGHVVGLRKLRQLQDLGHQVILIVGDWTAQIGDPSGQSVTRPMLTHEEVVSNAESYMRQFFRVVDRERTQVEWQSQWFGDFTLANVIELTSRFTVAQFLERDDFARRFADHQPIAITELLYPLLQAYDSVAIESDVEFGGTDQMFNLLVGRELQTMMGQTPQQCFLMPILVGTDGVQKMSKSLGNYVALEEPPEDMYGKIMSLPDELIGPYFEYLTDVPSEELAEMDQNRGETNPIELKKRLALEITSQFHERAAANAAQAQFENVVQRRGLPDDISEFAEPSLTGQTEDEGRRLSNIIFDAGLAASVSEAKRLINQGAIELIDNSTGDATRLTRDDRATSLSLQDRAVLKRGNRRFVRLVR